MGWRQWLGRGPSADAGDRQWREAWTAAVERPDRRAARQLRTELDALAIDDDRYDIEREMLDGLDALVDLSEQMWDRGPEPISTGHRAVGADRCYFSAPASMPDDPSQSAGTLLLTNTRAIFVGGARAVTAPWHAVARSLRQDRDLVLVRADREDLHRFRCNSFGDALRAVFLARHFAKRRV
jgi:hypothetical protein